MKMKGKALLSLLIVLTLVTQLFVVSANAAGFESVTYAVMTQDGSDPAATVVTMGATLNDLMTDANAPTITPPDGYYVAQVWLYGDDSNAGVPLPLTADPNGSATVRVKGEAFSRYENGTFVFDDRMLSPYTGGMYTLGVLVAPRDGADPINISDGNNNILATGSYTVGYAPYEDPNADFVGWNLKYLNGATALVAPGATVYPYASCTLTPAYATRVYVTAPSYTIDAGSPLAALDMTPIVTNLPSGMNIEGLNAYPDGAFEPLMEGFYTTVVNPSCQLLENGKPVDTNRAYLIPQNGSLTVNAVYVPQPDPIPEVPVINPDPVFVDEGSSDGEAVIDFGAAEHVHTLLEEARVSPTCTETGTELYYRCNECGAMFSDAEGYYSISEPVLIPATGHVWGEAAHENETAATCTEDGHYDEVVRCTVCGVELSRETKTILATGHIAGEAAHENETLATCTEDGHYDEVIRCIICGVELSRTTVTTTPATGHIAGEAVHENETLATCTEAGHYDEVVRCTVCGAELSREAKSVPATGHTPGEAVRENETLATCAEGGHYDEVVRCTVCGAELSRETKTIPATEHTPSEAVRENETAATCAEDGHYDEVVRCTVCGAELSRETKTIPATEHTPGEAVRENETAATCAEDGHYDEVVRCTVCGAELSRETKTVPATGHTPGEAVHENETAATCAEDGHYDEVVRCTVCGAELSRETKTVPATGHVWSDWVVTQAATEAEEGVETRTCQNDPSHVETRAIEKLTHTHSLTAIERKDPSYTEDGNIEYYLCSDCEKLFRDAEGKEEITLADTVLPKLEVFSLTVSVGGQSWTYDGAAHELSNDPSAYTVEGLQEGDTLTVSLHIDGAGTSVTDAGTYTITADVSGYDTDKYTVSVVPGTLTVTPPDITNVTVEVKDQAWTYDGTAHTLDASAYTVAGLKDGDTLTVTLSALDARGTELSSITDAGIYTINAACSDVDSSKYTVTITNHGKLTVSPYPLTITADSDSKVYDGAPLQNAQVTAALLDGHKFRDGDGLAVSVYDSNNSFLASGAIAVGNYTKKVSAAHIVDAANNEVTANYDITYVDGTLTITAPAVTPTPEPTPTPSPTPAPTPSPVIYASADGSDGVIKGWTKGTTEGLTFRVNADFSKFLNLVTVDGAQIPSSCYTAFSGSTVVTLSPNYLNTLSVGNHAISIQFSDGSYGTTFTVTDAPAVTPVPLTISGRNVSKTYDGNPYNLDSYGQNSQGIRTRFHLAQNGQYVAQAVNPGTYDIYLDELNLDALASQSAANGARTYQVTIKDSNGNVVSTDYQNTSVRIGTLTITNANITNVTVTVRDQAWTYDGTAHTLDASAYTVEGLQSGDNLSIKLSIVDASGRTLSAVTDAGTYNIKADYSGVDASKYKVTVANQGTLTVSPYKLTLTAESAVKNYDGTVLRNSNVKATALISGHKFRSGDGVKFSVYDSKGNLIQNGPVAVGTYTKKVTDVHIVDANNIEVTANYDITRVDGTLTINNSDGSPKTGDNNNLGLWIGLLAVSAVLIAAVATILLRRRKKLNAPVKAPEKKPDNHPGGKH